ncbi:MAG: hypothetical protein D6826_10100 [Alphaproteobacteria bacterium]|nr:MAG: hypothetical protein D6826_10100 [Alphaproteobacteria bacterium]
MALFVAAGPGPAFGQQGAVLSDYTVADLLKPCIEGDNASREGLEAESECEQYIAGFVDAYILLGAAEQDGVCLPAQNRRDEVRWVFTRWAYKHYSERAMPAAEGLIAAIRSGFKCP